MMDGRIAVFLDRDGVLDVEKNHLRRKEELELIENSAEAIRLLNENEYLAIVITNQAAVARGICTEDDVNGVHEFLKVLLSERRARLDRIYYCPHHPTAGSNPAYTRDCDCRKPKPGMILQAQKDFGVKDLTRCFMIGDKSSDIEAGKRAGCRTILVETGYWGKDKLFGVNPDYTAKDLYEAVEKIVLGNS